MSARNRRRQPTSPGEILREEFLVPLGMTQKQLADHLGCDVKVVNRIINRRTSVTAEMALRLGAAFRTSPEFWLNAQKAVDLYRAARELDELPKPLLKVYLAERVHDEFRRDRTPEQLASMVREPEAPYGRAPKGTHRRPRPRRS